MKKIFLIALFIFCILNNKNTILAQGEGVYVNDLFLDKTEYNEKEIIKGSVRIFNNSDSRESDVYIQTFISTSLDNQTIESDFQYGKNIYLESKSNNVFNFEHVLNTELNTKADLVVVVYSKDGTFLNQIQKPINIKSEKNKKILTLNNFNIEVDGKNFFPQQGPTVKKDGDIFINFKIDKVGIKGLSVKPKIELYNRTTFNNKPVETIMLDDIVIVLDSNKEYRLKLPTNINPLVYAGVLTFENAEYYIPSSYFRYILEGSIGTILNINTSSLDAKKGEKIKVNIEYAGMPLNITNEEAFDFNSINDQPVDFDTSVPEGVDISSMSSEEVAKFFYDQIEKDSTGNASNTQNVAVKKTATIKLSIFDRKNNLIGEGQTQINLSEASTTAVDVDISKTVSGFIVKAEMVDEEGNVLSKYETNLPSEKELKNVYSKNKDIDLIYMILIAFLPIIFIFIIMFYRKKINKKVSTTTLLFLIALTPLLLISQKAEAFTTEFAPSANSSQNFKLNSFISPQPTGVKMYQPGEDFTLQVNASYVACDNAGFNNNLFGPSDDWWNFNLNGIYEAADWQQGTNKQRFRGPRQTVIQWFNVLFYYGDTWGPRVLPRLASFWTGSGSIGGVQRHPVGVNNFLGTSVSGFMNNNVQGKGGKYLWSTGSWGNGYYNAGGHERSSNYNITAGTYKMPTTPGKHRFYIMLQNQARGNTSTFRIYSQEVCVAGAGVCPGESALVCPNLEGNFIEFGSTIRKQTLGGDYIDTNYTKNSQGQCVDNTATSTTVTSTSTTDDISCGCTNQNMICYNRTTDTFISNEYDSPQCSLSLTCLVSNSSDPSVSDVRLIASPLNGANIDYYKDNQKLSSNLFTINKTESQQTVPVYIIDNRRELTTVRRADATCNIPGINDIVSINQATTTSASTSITLIKRPKLTVNKGGVCNISWDIQNMPTGTSCTVVSVGENTLSPANPSIVLNDEGSGFGAVSVDPLNSNQKITVNCTGPSVNLSESVTCRINPEIREN